MSNNVYAKHTSFSDAYLELDETTVDGQFEQAIEQSISLSIKYEVFNTFVKQMTQMQYHCYECRRPISVDVSRILKYNNDLQAEEFLCDKHKVGHDISEKSIPFVKYQTAFLQKLSNFLLKTSNTYLNGEQH